MDIYQILCIILGVICVFILLMFIFINRKYSKTLKGFKDREVDGIRAKKGVRYTIDQTVIDENGEMNVSFGSSDIILKQNETEIVGKKNRVWAGKYTVLSTRDEDETFNLRIGKYVKEYKHNQKIVLSEGQEITAVNCDVILR